METSRRSGRSADETVIVDAMAARRRTIRRSAVAALVCAVAVGVLTPLRQQRFDRVERAGTRVDARVDRVTEWDVRFVWSAPPGAGNLTIDVPDRVYREGQRVPIKVLDGTRLVHVPGEGTEDSPLDAFLTIAWIVGILMVLVVAEMGWRYRFVRGQLASAPRRRVRGGVLIGRGPGGAVLAEYARTRLEIRRRRWERLVR